MENININSSLVIENYEKEQLELKSFGFWIYMMSDLVIFSILFATFIVLGQNYAGAPGPKQIFNIPYLFVETMLLLTSSFTYGLAMISLKYNNKTKLLISLLITFLLGAGFISMEMNEFLGLIGKNITPERSGFLSSFFTLVGTHGLHVSFGLFWMLIMMIQVSSKGINIFTTSRLIRLGLFWHFLDIVWVFVFTVVYLLGVL